MGLLDDRRTGILRDMGIPVWRLRSGTIPEDVEEETALDEDLPVSLVDADEGGGVIGNLEDIAARIASCRKCPLHASRSHTVPGTGNPGADWMFVGEGPGEQEDRQGLPFVGRSGELLTAMVAALGMERSAVFIANVVKCRPPGNRDPLPEEVDACEPYLKQQLDLVRPRVIVALGRVSAQVLLRTTRRLADLRGEVHRYGTGEVPLVVTYHPAYLLRSPGQKKKAWDDLILARSLLDSSPGAEIQQ